MDTNATQEEMYNALTSDNNYERTSAICILIDQFSREREKTETLSQINEGMRRRVDELERLIQFYIDQCKGRSADHIMTTTFIKLITEAGL